MKCTTCRDTDYIPAPPTNAWRLYFARIGRPHQHVLVPCPACGGVDGKANRRALQKRLKARKTYGYNPYGNRGKFSREEIQEIRALRGKMRNVDIGRRYGVHAETIAKIFRGETYAAY
jgi:hypothetical protein